MWSGLACFAFKPRCSITQGTWLLYCDPDNPCADPNLSCCYGVDENGNCLAFGGTRFGGCFDLRGEGENCSSPNNRYVRSGLFFLRAGNLGGLLPALFDRYRLQFRAGMLDFWFRVQDESQLVLSARRARLCSALSDPGQALGTVCRSNSDCESGTCLTYGGTSACSRP